MYVLCSYHVYVMHVLCTYCSYVMYVLGVMYILLCVLFPPATKIGLGQLLEYNNQSINHVHLSIHTEVVLWDLATLQIANKLTITKSAKIYVSQNIPLYSIHFHTKILRI